MYLHMATALSSGRKRKTHKVKSHIRHVNGKKIKVASHIRYAHTVRKRRH